MAWLQSKKMSKKKIVKKNKRVAESPNPTEKPPKKSAHDVSPVLNRNAYVCSCCFLRLDSSPTPTRLPLADGFSPGLGSAGAPPRRYSAPNCCTKFGCTRFFAVEVGVAATAAPTAASPFALEGEPTLVDFDFGDETGDFLPAPPCLSFLSMSWQMSLTQRTLSSKFKIMFSWITFMFMPT